MARPINGYISESIKVYMDDIMVKGPKRENYITNLDKASDILQNYRMKLNQFSTYSASPRVNS